MPTSADIAPTCKSAPLVLVATAACFALTVFVFYPGVMTYDARYVYQDIAKGFLGDWQSPVMTVIWAWIDPLAPGAASMFLLIALLYWLAIALTARSLRERPLAVVLLFAAALSPPLFVFVGIIWRDVPFAALWLMAAALALIAARTEQRASLVLRIVCLLLLALGVLLRPNALPAAPVLAAVLLWPRGFDWRRAVLLYAPLALMSYGVVHLTYYTLLHAERQNPLHSLFVFDLAGITHVTGENQFPVAWPDDEMKRLTGDCYNADSWDRYWTGDCAFAMRRIEGEAKLFGTPELSAAWRKAVLTHPLAWLRHRCAFMTNFLFGSNLTMWLVDIEDTSRTLYPDKPAFQALRSLHDALKPTPLFRAGTWLILCLVVCAFAWRRRLSAHGAFALGICGSAAVYVASFFIVGVASDFRYAFWAVLAGLAGAIVLAFGGGSPARGADLPDATAMTPSGQPTTTLRETQGSAHELRAHSL
jgi:hypothetical protein